MQIIYTKKFIKKLKKCDFQIKKSFKSWLKLFLKNKNSSILNNHSMNGRLKMYRSINISGDYRALFQEFDNGQTVYFVMIGNHSELYG